MRKYKVNKNNVKKKKQNKSLFIIVMLAVVVFSGILLIYVNRNKEINGNVATVNGEEVTAREFIFRMERGRGQVIQYFKDKHGVTEINEKFWNTSFGKDGTPMEYARKQTLDQITRIKVQQLLAQKKGLVKDISYAAFLKKLESENKSRKEAKEKGQVVYGVLEYGEEDYFSREFTKLKDQLTQKLVDEKAIDISEAMISDYYENNKADFKQQDYLKIQRLHADFGYEDEAGKKNAYNAIQAVQERLDKGESFDAVIASVKSDANAAVKYEDVIIDKDTEIINIENILDVRNFARDNEVNKISGIIEEVYSYDIVRCTEKKDNGYVPLEDRKSFIKSRLIESAYEKLIDEEIEKAKVKIDKQVYNKAVIDRKYLK